MLGPPITHNSLIHSLDFLVNDLALRGDGVTMHDQRSTATLKYFQRSSLFYLFILSVGTLSF